MGLASSRPAVPVKSPSISTNDIAERGAPNRTNSIASIIHSDASDSAMRSPTEGPAPRNSTPKRQRASSPVEPNKRTRIEVLNAPRQHPSMRHSVNRSRSPSPSPRSATRLTPIPIASRATFQHDNRMRSPPRSTESSDKEPSPTVSAEGKVSQVRSPVITTSNGSPSHNTSSTSLLPAITTLSQEVSPQSSVENADGERARSEAMSDMLMDSGASSASPPRSSKTGLGSPALSKKTSPRSESKADVEAMVVDGSAARDRRAHV